MRLSVGPLAGCLGFTFVAVLTTFACGVPDQPNYGPPGNIDGRLPPPAQLDDGGTAPPAAGGGTAGAASGACTDATLVDGGACAVTWSGDIFPNIQTKWSCGSAGCHGGTTTPTFKTTDAKTTWTAFRAIKNKAGLAYINPCSVDPAASYFAKNLQGTSGQQMPIPATTVTPDDLTKLQTWVACGAPFN